MSNLNPYKSILLDSEHIRVVHVDAGRWHDPIRCELIHHKLDGESVKHPYTALSYVWGSGSVTDTVSLGGVAFQITVNLSCALRHIRKTDEDTLLWVDALCINQRDHQERSVQVGIMQLIYQKAKKVVVFMGDGRDHRVNRSKLRVPPSSPTITLHGYEQSKSFLAEVLSLGHPRRPGSLASSLTAAACAMALVSLFSDQKSVEKGCLELMKLDEQTRYDLFECFRAYVTCPWWSRIWVVQEIAVGATVTIQYGTITLPWDALVSTADVWSLPMSRQVASSMGIEQENLKVFTRFANQLNGLEKTRQKWRAEGGDDFVRLLQEFSDRHATDDNDKVYGILSLVKKEQRYIEPNYKLEVFETYRATAAALIGKGGSLACWAGDQKRKSNLMLPSWIPDWSTAVEAGDKRRMDLFDSYATNGGWTIRATEGEREYWSTVRDEMELLIDSPAAKSGRLPASLRPLVHHYIELLKRRTKPLSTYNIDESCPQHASLENLPWSLWHDMTPRLALSCLSWCDNYGIYPFHGRILLQRWIHDLEETRTLDISEDGGPEYDSPRTEEIRQNLRMMQVAMNEEDFNTAINNAQHAIYEIESFVLRSETERARDYQVTNPPDLLQSEIWAINSAIERIFLLCSRLSELCKGSDNEINPVKLFQMSYSLQGSASWLTEFQYKQATLEDWDVGFSPFRKLGVSRRVLPMQTIKVDAVSFRGPRHFGWADKESGLTTLIFWLYFSGVVVVDRSTEEKEIRLNRERLRQFARTIIGGMCRHDASYREVDDGVLDSLEDWLRQCLTMDADGKSGWALPDPETGAYTFVGQLGWAPANERYGIGWVGGDYHWAHAAQPSEEWVRTSLGTNGFPVPPSPLFEDIQIATDGRAFFLTENGSMGLGPASIEKGDTIHILPSGRAHFVLRRKPPKNSKWMEDLEPDLQPDQFELIGDCYLHTNGTADNQPPAEEEPAIKGSLPFEFLGAQYLEMRGSRTRKTVLLV